MLLQNKITVVYGAGGAIGGAVARAFAAEGATVFLTGRRQEPLDAVAKEIVAKEIGGPQIGGAETAVVDALDERAVEAHLDAVITRAGRVDVSFNAVGVPDAAILGTPFTELGVEAFLRPVTDYARSYFLTARAAARRMLPQRAGVIMTVTAIPARMGSALNGGYGPASAAKEALTRDLSAELAPHGIRVVGLRPHGLPETESLRRVHQAKADRLGLSWEQFVAYLEGTSHTRRAMRVQEVADLAVFMACDRASGMTGTTVNLTMGRLDD